MMHCIYIAHTPKSSKLSLNENNFGFQEYQIILHWTLSWSIYLMLTDDELIGSDIFSSPRRLCIDLLSQNSSRFRNMSVNLDGSDYEILNILEEMRSWISWRICPSVQKNLTVLFLNYLIKMILEVMKDSTFALAIVENRLCGYFCLEINVCSWWC